MARYVAVTYPKDLTINIVVLMRWAKTARKIQRVTDVLDQYPCIMENMALSITSPSVFEADPAEAAIHEWPFVVPSVLVTFMQAAIETY
ncbi:hypothetical protein GN244_ATG14135 [Phytophthora infestans]|uniref:Uncharacterized protein n=1 Tax=Phytophthora infestans TaxID=4787 RepID=A0A833T519_PHYIN|nr:hypothetical protein GN244_ATG14135 [Phytophthora infestans]KAF4144361.1 hypothetical protein GN958_ATG06455 [Phytophthora infestans]